MKPNFTAWITTGFFPSRHVLWCHKLYYFPGKSAENIDAFLQPIEHELNVYIVRLRCGFTIFFPFTETVPIKKGSPSITWQSYSILDGVFGSGDNSV